MGTPACAIPVGLAQQGCFLFAELRLVQLSVQAASSQQSLVRAALYDHSILKHENDVRPADGDQAVCDDDAGFSGHQPVERIKNNRLR